MFTFLEETFRMLESVLLGFGNDLGRQQKQGYNAEFMREREILSSRGTGFCLTGRRNLSVKKSYENALIIGATGTGKSSIVLWPSLFSMRGSFIIHDPSGELHAKSAGYLAQQGYTIQVLHFTKPECSSGYNPLVRANTSSDIQKVASMLIENSLGGAGAKDPFWGIMAVSLLTIIIGILKTQAPEYQNLYNARILLNELGNNPQAVHLLFKEYADDILWCEYSSFMKYDEKVVSSTIASTKSALQIFNDESVARVTAFDSIDFTTFRTKKVALFIQNAIADQRYFAPLTALFFEQCFASILSRFPADTEQDIFFLIDEASSLKLPTLPLAVANMRKHRAGTMLCLQSFDQLVKNYTKHDAEAIRSNCFAKMYFTGATHETTKELEGLLGKVEVKDEAGRKDVRPLMSADAIRTMQLNQALILCGHHKPILAKLYPYYENPTYRKFSNIPPPPLTNQMPYTTLPILPLQTPDDDE